MKVKKIYFFRRISFSSSEKLTFGKENVIFYVPEVLNVHMNESKKKSTFFRRILFSSSEKLTFEKENVFFFFNTYLNFNLFYSIVVIFL